jgi:hypothetical protein
VSDEQKMKYSKPFVSISTTNQEYSIGVYARKIYNRLIKRKRLGAGWDSVYLRAFVVDGLFVECVSGVSV